MTAAGSTATLPRERTGFWDRELHRYPSATTRFTCLGIVVLATIVLYYQFYLAGAVATHILADYNMSFVYYVNISVVGYILGAAASFATGMSDRYGRANIVTVGLFIVGLLCLFGIPLAHSKVGFGIVYVAIGLVEGIILVATPALIRDFSPQLGRASAMGFWTLGPVLGSLVVSVQVSNTSDSTAWQDHYIAAGIVGIVVALLSAVFLRELTPALRDQLMVSSRDRALIEARAKGIDVATAQQRPFRQMLKPDIILSAFAISVFLIIYYAAVGFFPAYFQTIFGFSQKDANGLGNWNWAFNAGALLIVGFLSDKIRVRKPFMIVGALGAIATTIIFLTRATHPETSYYTFVLILSLMAVSLGVAYAPWMASFTETVERRNPALTATGLAVWGLVIRIVIAVAVFIVPHMVNTVTTLVQDGPQAQVLAAKYGPQIATAQKLDPATSAALAANPKDQNAGIKAVSELSGVSVANVTTVATLAAQHGQALAAGQALDQATATALLTNPNDTAAAQKAVGEVSSKLNVSAGQAQALLQELSTIPVNQLLVVQQNGAKVQAAQTQLQKLGAVPATVFPLLQKVGSAAEKSPKQWQHYYWIAVGGEIVFIPLIFLMAGFWSPRRARQKEEEHEAWVQAELARLNN
jgi:ACS family D-galactonate transporter-like MFS transporter